MGLVTVPLAGVLLDWAGARPVLAAVIAGQALAEAGLVWAHSTATALPVLLVQGAAFGSSFPAYNTMLAGINPDPGEQQQAFAVSFIWMNAGVGCGAAVGALMADVHHAASFQIMFAGSAVLAGGSAPWCPGCRTRGRRTSRCRRRPDTVTCSRRVACAP